MVSSAPATESSPDVGRPSRLLTRQQFADFVGVGVATVARWQRDGLPLAICRGRVVRVDTDSALAWLSSTPVRRRGRPRNTELGSRA